MDQETHKTWDKVTQSNRLGTFIRLCVNNSSNTHMVDVGVADQL